MYVPLEFGLEIEISSKKQKGKVVFLKISLFLERIQMEHIDMKNSLDSQLRIIFTYSIRILPRS